jgi:hypothetical protein
MGEGGPFGWGRRKNLAGGLTLTWSAAGSGIAQGRGCQDSGGFNATGPEQAWAASYGDGLQVTVMGCNLGGGLKSHVIGYMALFMLRSSLVG